MRIRCFPCDLEGSGCYRVIYPYGMIDAFSEHEVVMQAEMHDDRMLLPIPPGMVGYGEQSPADELAVEMFMDSDVFVFQRPMEKLYPGVIMKLKMSGKKVVVELDDFMHGLASPTPRAGMKKASKRASTEALTLCVRMADLVTVSTDALAEEYRKYNENVVVLKNRLRPSDFNDITPSYRKDRPLTIGWLGLMDYRANDLSLLKPWLNRFLKRHPEVRFLNIGSRKALDYLCVPKAKRDHIEAITFPGHFRALQNLDIGLVPLTKNRFNECKSYLKGMEYGAVGAAVVASRTNEYAEWIDDGYNGMLVTQLQQWEDALEELLKDDNWRKVAEHNHQKAMKHLITDHYQEWITPHVSSSPHLHPRTPELHTALLRESAQPSRV